MNINVVMDQYTMGDTIVSIANMPYVSSDTDGVPVTFDYFEKANLASFVSFLRSIHVIEEEEKDRLCQMITSSDEENYNLAREILFEKSKLPEVRDRIFFETNLKTVESLMDGCAWDRCPLCQGTGYTSYHHGCSVCNGTKIINRSTGRPPQNPIPDASIFGTSITSTDTTYLIGGNS